MYIKGLSKLIPYLSLTHSRLTENDSKGPSETHEIHPSWPLTCGICTAHLGRITGRMVRRAIPEITGNGPADEKRPIRHRSPIPHGGEEVVLFGVIETTAGVLIGSGDNGVELVFGEGSGGHGREGPRLGYDATVP